MRVDKPVKVHWEGSKSVAWNAREKLPELARGFFETGRALAASHPSLQALHRFRLLTKRFRYTLELFRPCYGPVLDLRIEALKTLQQYLGEISDCATTRKLLAGRDDLSKPKRDRLTRQLKVLAAARVARFRRLWRKDFEQPERERWWTDYLRRFARD